MVIVQELNSRIKLRRADKTAYDAHPDFLPQKGEVCFVDQPNGEFKIKVGDGLTKFIDLEWAFANIVTGYFFEGDFYYDAEHTAKAGRYTNTIYIEIENKVLYFFDGANYIEMSSIVEDATPTRKGIMKLYPSTGNNTDGTITQLGITNGLGDLKLYVEGETLKTYY